MMYLICIYNLKEYEVVRCSLRFGLDCVCQLTSKVVLLNDNLEVVGCNFTKIKNIRISNITKSAFTLNYGLFMRIIGR